MDGWMDGIHGWMDVRADVCMYACNVCNGCNGCNVCNVCDVM